MDNPYTYEQGKEMEAALIREVDKWDAILKQFPRGVMGLTDDAVKKSPEYREAKAQFDAAFAKQRLFSAGFTKRYKKEMLAERAAQREKYHYEQGKVTEVIYINRNGKQDILWFGAACTHEDVKRRIQDMREAGFKVIRYYPVKHIG